MSSIPSVATEAPARERVAVVGGGAWGTTLSALASCAAARRRCGLASPRWSARSVSTTRTACSCPVSTLPADDRATTELDEALTGADVVVVAVPAQHVRDGHGPGGAWIAAARSW